MPAEALPTAAGAACLSRWQTAYRQLLHIWQVIVIEWLLLSSNVCLLLFGLMPLALLLMV
jgi:hypothetical protein